MRVGADGLLEQALGRRVVHVDIVVIRKEELHRAQEVIWPRQLPQPLDAIGSLVDFVLVRLEPCRICINLGLILPGANPIRHVPVGVEYHVFERLRDQRREPLLDALAILVDSVHPLPGHDAPPVDFRSLVLQRRLEARDVDEDVLLAEVGGGTAEPPPVECNPELCEAPHRCLIQRCTCEFIQLPGWRQLPEPLVGLQCSAKRCVEGRVAGFAGLKSFGCQPCAQCYNLRSGRLLRQHLPARQRLPCIARRVIHVSAHRRLQWRIVECGGTQPLEEGLHIRDLEPLCRKPEYLITPPRRLGCRVDWNIHLRGLTKGKLIVPVLCPLEIDPCEVVAREAEFDRCK